MTTLNATFDPFVGTLTTKNMASGALLLEGDFYRLKDYVKRGDTTRSCAVDDGFNLSVEVTNSS